MSKNAHIIFRYILLFASVFVLHIHSDAKNKRIVSLSDSTVNDYHSNSLVTAKLIECFPNPATAYINFKFDKSVVRTSKLYIYSFTGKQMNVLSITDNSIKVSLDNYYRGLYTYQLRDANGNIVESGKFQVRN